LGVKEWHSLKEKDLEILESRCLRKPNGGIGEKELTSDLGGKWEERS